MGMSLPVTLSTGASKKSKAEAERNFKEILLIPNKNTFHYQDAKLSTEAALRPAFLHSYQAVGLLN